MAEKTHKRNLVIIAGMLFLAIALPFNMGAMFPSAEYQSTSVEPLSGLAPGHFQQFNFTFSGIPTGVTVSRVPPPLGGATVPATMGTSGNITVNGTFYDYNSSAHFSSATPESWQFGQLLFSNVPYIPIHWPWGRPSIHLSIRATYHLRNTSSIRIPTYDPTHSLEFPNGQTFTINHTFELAPGSFLVPMNFINWRYVGSTGNILAYAYVSNIEVTFAIDDQQGPTWFDPPIVDQFR